MYGFKIRIRGDYALFSRPEMKVERVSYDVPTPSALVGLIVWDLSLSIYAQLGLVMLIGLSAKNAILMIEFSKQSREAGHSITSSAMLGASLRFRAVLMTAWSFLFGVFPLVIATGAGAGSRRAIGVTTFCGMLAATLVGIVFAPALYALFQRLRERCRRKIHLPDGAPEVETEADVPDAPKGV